MNRLLLFGLFLGVSCLLQPVTTLAQGSLLETRALREDYRRLQSQLADLLEAHNALKSELSKLRTEVRQLKPKLVFLPYFGCRRLAKRAQSVPCNCSSTG